MQAAHAEDVMELHKEDLVAYLAMRYGLVPTAMFRYIEGIDDPLVLDHLLAAARSSSTWGEFVGHVRRDDAAVKRLPHEMKVVS
jgi:hypothetical protein